MKKIKSIKNIENLVKWFCKQLTMDELFIAAGVILAFLNNKRKDIKCKSTSPRDFPNYRKFYEEDGVRYSHTIDPASGYPVQHSMLSVSVLAENTAIADAYATAFMVMGIERASQFVIDDPSLEAFFIYADKEGNYQTFISDGFKAVISVEY